MVFRRFPDFGRELRRPFEVHATCFDCAEFYDGCHAWPASKPFACGAYTRLPDVMPGTCGQKFPETRHRTARPAERQEDAAPAVRRRPPRPKGESRLCDCGVTLPKNRRLCDPCRDQKRRRTRREYMRGYMQQRRTGSVQGIQPDSDVPSAVAYAAQGQRESANSGEGGVG